MSSRDLPVEILHHVFKYLTCASRNSFDLKAKTIDKKALSTCTLVSKNWKRPAQIILYKHLTIATGFTLELLLKTVKSNQELANTVKSLQLGLLPQRAEVELIYKVEELFSCLSYLEAITISDTTFCLPLLNVLIDSKLPRLRSMSTVSLKSHFGDFITCALLARKQLETFNIFPEAYNSRIRGENNVMHFNRLHSRLDQFENLSELSIWKHSGNNIDFMESVTESCLVMKKLTFLFLPESLTDEEEENLTVIDEYKPRSNIKYLKCSGRTNDISQHLSYTMQKYPQLNKLGLELSTSFNAPKIDISLLSQFVAYLSKIKVVVVSKLLAEFEIIAEPIGLFWKPFTETGIVHCTFRYSEHLPPGVAKLDLRSKSKGLTNCTSVEYSLNRMMELEHTNIIKRYGNLIRILDIAGLEDFKPESEPMKDMVFGQFVVDIFKHCPNIEKLLIDMCVLKKINVCEGDTSKRFKLERLSLNQNSVHDGVLNSFSKFIAETKYLELLYNKFRDVSGKYNSTITIDMPYTKVDHLVLLGSGNPHRGTRYIFVKLSTQLEGNRFYMYDDVMNHEQGSNLKPSSEQEYQDDKNSQNTHVFVTCKSIDTLAIQQEDIDLFANLR
jgi:hypothetical protein